MKKRSMLSVTVALAIMVWVLAGTSAFADSYEVTVTNLTRGQWFTPIMVASHLKGVSLFTPGQPASDELALLAEQGDTGPLTTLLLAMPEVMEVGNSGGLLGPGESVTVDRGNRHRIQQYQCSGHAYSYKRCLCCPQRSPRTNGPLPHLW